MRLYAMIGAALFVLGLIAWGTLERKGRLEWKEYAQTIRIDLDEVTRIVGKESGNPKLRYDLKTNGAAVKQQVELLGQAKRGWQDTATLQSQRIADLNREQQKLEKLSADLRRKAEAAIAQRNRALLSLEQIELTPAEQVTCEQQLEQAEKVLDLLFEQGV